MGTTFDVYLPRAGTKASSITHRALVEMPRAVRASVIAIVDDTEPLRDVAADVLRRVGYQVVVAEDGEHALERLRELENPVDLLVTDVKMPRMDGVALARHVAAEFPTVPVVFMTGYLDAATLEALHAERPTSPVLAKPFR